MLPSNLVQKNYELCFVSFLLRVNFCSMALTNNLFWVQLFIFVAQNVIDCMWYGRYKKAKIDAKNV